VAENWVGWVGEGVGVAGEGNLGGVRVGLGHEHRFAAAWVRVRAAFRDG